MNRQDSGPNVLIVRDYSLIPGEYGDAADSSELVALRPTLTLNPWASCASEPAVSRPHLS